MRTLRLSFFLVMALMLTLGGAAGAACNGGDELTLAEFFQRLDDLDNEFEQRSEDLDAEFEGLSEQETLEQAPDIFRQQLDVIRDFVDGLSELDPPEEAADLHEEAVSAGRDVAEKFGDRIDDVEDAISLEALVAIFQDDDFTATIDRFDQVCLDAEQLAADNDITIDLNCEEEEEG